MEQYAYRQQQNGIYSSDSNSEDDEEDDDEDDDDFDDEEDDEDEDDDDNYQNDEYRSDTNEKEPQFSKTLTVKGSIITVADDLLKNDGKKFLDMMEKLAERKMLKEREVTNSDLFDEDEDDEYNDNEGNEDDDEGEDEDDNERVNTHINTKKQLLINIYRIPEQKSNEWKKAVKCSKYLQQECLNKECLLLIEKRSHKIDKNVLLKNWKKRIDNVKRENSKNNKIKKRKKIKNGKKKVAI